MHHFWAILHGGQFLLVEEARVPRENHRPFDRKTDNPSQVRLESSAPARAGFKLTTLVLTG